MTLASAAPRVTVTGMRALVFAAVLATGPSLAACFTPADAGACRDDSDCAGAVCTRVGECAAEPYALRVTWTIAGQAASVAGACAAIGELELAIADPSLDLQHALRPVPCGAGSFFFDKLPLGYTDVTVTAFGLGGRFLTSARATAVGAGGAVTVDLRP